MDSYSENNKSIYFDGMCYRAYNIEKFLMWKPVALSRFAQA